MRTTMRTTATRPTSQGSPVRRREHAHLGAQVQRAVLEHQRLRLLSVGTGVARRVHDGEGHRGRRFWYRPLLPERRRPGGGEARGRAQPPLHGDRHVPWDLEDLPRHRGRLLPVRRARRFGLSRFLGILVFEGVRANLQGGRGGRGVAVELLKQTPAGGAAIKSPCSSGGGVLCFCCTVVLHALLVEECHFVKCCSMLLWWRRVFVIQCCSICSACGGALSSERL